MKALYMWLALTVLVVLGGVAYVIFLRKRQRKEGGTLLGSSPPNLADATPRYLTLAAQFESEEFYLKAVAVYKLLLKANPELFPSIKPRLSALHEKLGLPFMEREYTQPGSQSPADVLRQLQELDTTGQLGQWPPPQPPCHEDGPEDPAAMGIPMHRWIAVSLPDGTDFVGYTYVDPSLHAFSAKGGPRADADLCERPSVTVRLWPECRWKAVTDEEMKLLHLPEKPSWLALFTSRAH